MIDALPNCL